MIQYVKSGLDETVVRLLNKLEPDFPARSLIIDIENFHVTVNKVLYDGKLYGILLCRGWRSHKGDLCLEIDHAVAEDGIEIHFSAILAESLFAWVYAHGFDRVFQHSHRPGLARMLEKHYGKAKEQIFSKDLKQWARDHQVVKQISHHPQPTHASGRIMGL
jgi:hypothetical protein